MSRVSTWLALGLVLIAMSIPASGSCAQHDQLLVIANRIGPPAEVDAGDLDAIFRSRMQYWPSGRRIIPLNLRPGSRHRTTFDRAVLRMSPDDAARFWIEQRVRGEERPPRQIPSADVMLRVVARLPGSIGYVNSRPTPSGVRVLARIRNGQVHVE